MTQAEAPILVIGAGIVGTAAALYLRLAGAEVTLIDRDTPGSGCSSGNAGMLGSNSCIPSALPGILSKVPGMMRGPGGAVGLSLRDILGLSPWLVRFIRSGRRARVEEIADALNALQRHVMSAYDELLAAADARGLVWRSGKLHTYETERAWIDGQYGLDLQRRRDIAFEELSGDEARELMPLLGESVRRAVHYPGIAHAIDPQAMVEALAARFAAGGGRIRRSEVRDIESNGTSGTAISADGPVYFSRAVLAAGYWSRDLARRLGTRIPVAVQRGYHVTLPSPAGNAPMPVKSEDRKIIVTPMRDGQRVTGVAEFAAPDAPAAPGRHAALAVHAKALMPDLADTYDDPWIGSRPCTPDSLPVLDRSPRYRNIFFAFGHGHLGLGLGPISGRLMSELVLTGRSSIDLAPFSASRF